MKIYVVGFGPGDKKFITPQAQAAIEAADCIVGYNLYVKLIEHLINNKKVIATGMKKEVERCKAALAEAESGSTVAVVCSGDAGVYGMAGLMLELAGNSGVDVEVVPGITAALSAAAVLGAPLIQDFAVISLSDLLTPWEAILKRVELASEADFTICIYNARSKTRKEHLSIAVELMLKHKKGNTPCGYVKNIGREAEYSRICELAGIPFEDIDMFTTLIVGNSNTKIMGGKMVTPRGYNI